MLWVRFCVKEGRWHLPALRRCRIGDARLCGALLQTWNRTADTHARHEARHALGPSVYVDSVQTRLAFSTCSNASGRSGTCADQVSLSHLALVCGKRSQNLLLFAVRHLEEVKCSPKLSRDFIELGGRNLQFAMG